MRGTRAWLHLRLLRAALSKTHPPKLSTPFLRTFSAASRAPSRPINLSRIAHFQPPRRIRNVRYKNDKPSSAKHSNPTPHLGSPEPQLSLSQRLKKLSREYGWSAFGVYMALTALDFPFCFLAVRALGTDRIGHYEQVVVQTVKGVFGLETAGAEDKAVLDGNAPDIPDRPDDFDLADDIEEAEAKKQVEGASIWTELALAYAIHKTFIFVRVPLTAAITPKVVKTLRGWGWDIGKRKPKTP